MYLPPPALFPRVTAAKCKHSSLKVGLQIWFLFSGGSHDVSQARSGICCWTKRLKITMSSILSMLRGLVHQKRKVHTSFPNIPKPLLGGKPREFERLHVGMNAKGFMRPSCLSPPHLSILPLPRPFQRKSICITALNDQREANKRIGKEFLKFP